MPLPFIFALGGAIIGAGTGAALFAKIGRWLQSHLSNEEVAAVRRVCETFGIDSPDDYESLSEQEQEELLRELNKIRDEAAD